MKLCYIWLFKVTVFNTGPFTARRINQGHTTYLTTHPQSKNNVWKKREQCLIIKHRSRRILISDWHNRYPQTELQHATTEYNVMCYTSDRKYLWSSMKFFVWFSVGLSFTFRPLPDKITATTTFVLNSPNIPLVQIFYRQLLANSWSKREVKWSHLVWMALCIFIYPQAWLIHNTAYTHIWAEFCFISSV